VAAIAIVFRARGLQRGLIYPDGYQYLLMARGIAGHLSPTVQLGHGGLLFVPTGDSALKPLFPALTALLSPVSGIRGGAGAVTVVAGAAAVVLAGMVAQRITGSLLAGTVAAGAALASHTLADWSGFAGPDPLAEALALATVLAVLYRRPVAAGVLGGLCTCARPEWGLVLLALAAAGLARRGTRTLAGTALLSGAFTVAIVIGVLRPPLAVPKGGPMLLAAALAAAVVLQLATGPLSARTGRASCATAIGLLIFAAAAAGGRVAALAPLLRHEWPLLALAVVGVLRASRTGYARPALMLIASVATLGAAYVYRNAGYERYLAELLPLGAVAAGFAAAPLAASERRRRMPAAFAPGAAAVALLALGAELIAPMPRLAPDLFAQLAPQLAHQSAGTLVSAAPDAYGFLLPGRPQQQLRPGERGLILLDGAQRAYDRELTAQGVVLARLSAPNGFARADGTLDTQPVELVRGVVVKATGADR
jgi:hypothetical protein